MIQQPQHKESSKMLVLSNCRQNYHTFTAILSHYFPLTQDGHLHLETKYYSADIEITHQKWPALADLLAQQPKPQEESLQPQKKAQDKQDLLIMLVKQCQSFPPQLYDLIIQKYNPDNFLLIVNTIHPEQPWKEEQLISSEVNNFIQIIKENLEEIKNNPPERKKKGLLTDNYEDGSVFNLLELMETTQWSHITRTLTTDHKDKESTAAQQPEPLSQTVGSEGMQPQPEKQEFNEEQFQAEMDSFESLMRQMLTLKESPPPNLSHGTRKENAEKLINKLLTGSFH